MQPTGEQSTPVPTFELRGLKSFTGREGLGYNVTLVIDGVPAAEVLNDGNGGMSRWYWLEQGKDPQVVRQAQAKWDAYVASRPLEPGSEGFEPFQPDADYVLAGIIDEHESKKRVQAKLRRDCKKWTIFQLPTGGCKVVRQPFSPALKAAIQAQHPGVALTFLNEALG